MRYVRLFAAMLVACISIVPALSMQDNGNEMKECAKQMDSPCQKSLMSEKAPDLQQQDRPNLISEIKKENSDPRSMMDGKEDPCREDACGNDPCGQNRQTIGNREDAPKSMMDGKLLNLLCKKIQAGQDDKIAPVTMMDSREGPCSQYSENSQSDKVVFKSMMDGKRNPCGQDLGMGQNMGSMNDIAAPR